MTQLMRSRVLALKGDIVRFVGDAIVNAANESLLGGGGVDGAIHRAAGPALLEECRKVGRCPTGEARLTRGYRLPARHVIHTVGPVWRGGDHGEDRLLESCYRSVMAVMREQTLDTVAFPAISTGIYGFPVVRATAIAVQTIADEIRRCETATVTFVCFDDATLDVYNIELGKLRDR